MNLIIDVGNTNVKLALFEKAEVCKKYTTKSDDLISTIKAILKENPHIDHTIVSSVGKLESSTINWLKTQLKAFSLDVNTKLPFVNLYESPKTLGVDRVALVSASVKHYPNCNSLIIDAGTCITYDFINNENEYLGGAISPGIRLRYRSLNSLTANLPLLDTAIPRNLIGKSTEDSIHSGVINGVLNEIDGLIDAYKLKYSDLTIILTGGDAKFLSKQLKSSIFANSNFLLEGLNFILDYNKN